jgi:anti-anti-sigma regulatory factor
MATNFRISVHKNAEHIDLKLIGVFDGTSAYELLHTLAKCSHHTSRIYIDTGCLKEINPFGLQVFQDNLDLLKGAPLELIFAGEYACELAPEEPIPLYLKVSTAINPGLETPSITAD